MASLYIWPEGLPAYTPVEFTTWLLEEIEISITPGTVFGPHGEGYARISLGMATDRVRQAMDRLQAFRF